MNGLQHVHVNSAVQSKSRATYLALIMRNVWCATRRERQLLISAQLESHLRLLYFTTEIISRCLLVGCITSQQHASVSQGRICSDNCTCCHTETEVADQTFHLTQSQYINIGSTSLSTDPLTPGVWQGSQWSANFEVTGMTRPQKNLGASGIRTRELSLSRRTS